MVMGRGRGARGPTALIRPFQRLEKRMTDANIIIVTGEMNASPSSRLRLAIIRINRHIFKIWSKTGIQPELKQPQVKKAVPYLISDKNRTFYRLAPTLSNHTFISPTRIIPVDGYGYKNKTMIIQVKCEIKITKFTT